jgi:hypothetical protein
VQLADIDTLCAQCFLLVPDRAGADRAERAPDRPQLATDVLRGGIIGLDAAVNGERGAAAGGGGRGSAASPRGQGGHDRRADDDSFA